MASFSWAPFSFRRT